jgi:uncharacterized membrane protein YesL
MMKVSSEQLAASSKQPGRETLFDYVQTASRFMVANLLWVVFSLPLVTMPAATAALFSVMLDMVRGRSPEPLADFLGGLRRYWFKSTLLALLNLAVAALIVTNLLIFGRMDLGRLPTLLSLGATLLALILLLMVNFYAWPLLTLLDLPLPRLLEKSLKLALAHPAWTLLMTIAAVSPLLLSLLLPRAFLLFLSFATATLITTSAAWRIIQRYL